MFLQVVMEYEDVIHVDENATFKDFNMEDVVHHRLECAGGIGESKEHDKRFIEAMIHSESCLPLIAFLNPNIIVTPSDVQFGVVLILESIDEFRYEG
jgi:hypothetical protein